MAGNSSEADEECRRSLNFPIYRTPDGLAGLRVWSRNASLYQMFYNTALPYVLQSIDDLPVRRTDEPFVVCDYGAADGGTSMTLMSEMIRAVRRKFGVEKPILIVYEDQPWNDFKSLFYTTQGLYEDQPTYLHESENVYVLASGCSFFKSCLPPNYVDLGMSSVALHVLSRRPCKFKDDIFYFGTKATAEEREAYRKQAIEDWGRLLQKRAKELKPGARFIAIMKILKDHKPNGMDQSDTYFHIYLRDQWLSYVREGKITKEEFENTNCGFCFLFENDIKAPFQPKHSGIAQVGLNLICLEIKEFVFDSCLRLRKIQGQADLDPDTQMIKKYVNVIRAWAYSTFTSGLNERRPQEEKKAIVDALFSQMEKDVLRNPEKFNYEVVAAYLTIEKESSDL